MAILGIILVAMGSTTRVKSVGKQKLIALSFMVAGCLGVLILAFPRFIASIYALYPESVFETQHKLPLAVYEKSIEDLDSALAWNESSKYWQMKAFFFLEQLNSSSEFSFKKKQEMLKQAQNSIIQGLKLSPVDPYGWFRLAVVDKELNINSQKIISALRLSILAGRVEPELMISRLSFGYVYYGEFDAEMQKIWKSQILGTWIFQPVALIEFVASHPETKQYVEEALAEFPHHLEKFSHDFQVFFSKTHPH